MKKQSSSFLFIVFVLLSVVNGAFLMPAGPSSNYTTSGYFSTCNITFPLTGLLACPQKIGSPSVQSDGNVDIQVHIVPNSYYTDCILNPNLYRNNGLFYDEFATTTCDMMT